MDDPLTPDPTLNPELDPALQAAPQEPIIPEKTDAERDAEAKAELLKGVESVLGKEDEKPADAKPNEEVAKPAEQAQGTLADKPAETKPENAPAAPEAKDDDKLDFKDHPRFLALKKLEADHVAAATAWHAEKTAMQSDVSHIVNLRTFLNDSGLSGKEFADGLALMRAMKNDPAQAMKLLQPHVAHLEKFTGSGAIEGDIQKRIDDGEISEAAGREIMQLRAAQTAAQHQAKTTVQLTQRQEAARAQQDIEGAVVQWEAAKSAADPDYEARKALTYRILQASAAVTPATNRHEAINLAEAAYQEATRLLPRQAVTPKPATQNTPSSALSSQARRVVAQQPKTLVEGVEAAMAGV